MTRRPLKNGPSQVAHAETPKPMNACSLGRPSSLAEAPVATISARASYNVPSAHTLKGRTLKSTRSTSPLISSVPWCAACSRMRSIRSGPMIASRKPG